MTADRLRSPVTLLAAQGVALGLLCGFVIIPASGIFLARYGSEGLPFVYLVVALAGGLMAPLMAYALRRWSLASVCVPVLAITSALVTAVWLGLELADAAWLSFVLQVLFPLLVQVGFVFIGGQAGRLLTVRQMKEQFPRIVSGFVVGFLLSGMLAPPLLAVVGATERLLAGTSISAIILLALVLQTRRLFPAELGTVDEPQGDGPRLPLRKLATGRLVMALLGYQLMSMLGTQLVDFLVFDRAAARFTTSQDLARFTSAFTVALNVSDLLFLTVAGLLLRRFGMRLGLTANPVIVSALVIVGAVSGGALGVGSMAMFMAVCGARITDISLTDGATRTSINTAYQALPSDQRLGVQATVEGIGGPFAIGITGVLLLVVQRGFGGGPLAVSAVAVAVCLLWMLSASSVYRQYQTSLHNNLRRRVLKTADLLIDDDASAAVMRRLLDGDAADVVVALDVITAQPDASDRLSALLAHGAAAPLARSGALQRLARVDPQRVAALGADEADPIVGLAAVIANVADGAQVAEPIRFHITRSLSHTDPYVRAAAFRAAVSIGDEPMMASVLGELASGRPFSTAADAWIEWPQRYASLLDRQLSDPRAAPVPLVRLIRSCPKIHESTVAAVLARHAEHKDRDVGLAVLRALDRVAPAGDKCRLEVATTTIRMDAAHSLRLVHAIGRVSGSPETQALCDALRDELLLLRRRTLASLALVGDRVAVHRAAQLLDGGDQRAAALALETIEVTVPTSLRMLSMPLLQPTDDHRGRLQTLSKVVSSTSTPVALDDLLTDLMRDGEDIWRRPWLQACALHAAVSLGRPVADRLVEMGAGMPEDGAAHETAMWARTRSSTLAPDAEFLR